MLEDNSIAQDEFNIKKQEVDILAFSISDINSPAPSFMKKKKTAWNKGK